MSHSILNESIKDLLNGVREDEVCGEELETSFTFIPTTPHLIQLKIPLTMKICSDCPIGILRNI